MSPEAQPPLAPRHVVQLAESGIDEPSALAHGFRTVSSRSDLVAIGFPEAQARRLQRNLPGLAVPSWGSDGTIAGYQVRLDNPPLVGGKGMKRPLRYVSPDGATNVLDLGPAAKLDDLGDPRCPMFIVEGVKKAVKLRMEVALAGRRAVVVGISGIWGWKSINELHGKTAHPLLVNGALAFNDGRLVIIAYDSDVWSGAPSATASGGTAAIAAREAVLRLAALLRARGANPKFLVLDPLDSGEKQGVDDFLVNGGSFDGLNQFVNDDAPPPVEPESPEHAYREIDGQMIYLRPTPEGPVPVVLANFTARIIAQAQVDDGAERSAVFTVSASLRGRSVTFDVTAARFESLTWISEQLGAEAIVSPGQMTASRVRAAIKHLSLPIATRYAYGHTGWVEHDGHHVYLHSRGGIGQDGIVPEVECDLDGTLERYTLPAPPVDESELAEAVRATLALLELAPPRVVVPLLCSIVRAPLGSTSTALHVVGRSGLFKSEVVALAQQHFGPEMNAQHLPGSWESTDNALEEMAFRAKDALLVIDDFCPRGAQADHARLHARAARIFRATGNRSARQRMRVDGTLRPSRPPRCLVVSTGEDMPGGASIRARLLAVEVRQGDIDPHVLTELQEAGTEGRFAAGMSAYINWLAARLGAIRQAQPGMLASLRTAAYRSDAHRRTKSTIADLAFGLGWWLSFAVESGVVDPYQAEELFRSAWNALGEVGAAQGAHQEDADAARRYVELLASALVSGEAHVADGRHDGPPDQPVVHGWSQLDDGRWVPRGRRVGWRVDDEIWLEADAAFGVVARMANQQGTAFPVGKGTAARRLSEAGLLVQIERREDGTARYAARRTIPVLGVRMGVLTLRPVETWAAEVSVPSSPFLGTTRPISWRALWNCEADGESMATPPANESIDVAVNASDDRDARSPEIASTHPDDTTGGSGWSGDTREELLARGVLASASGSRPELGRGRS